MEGGGHGDSWWGSEPRKLCDADPVVQCSSSIPFSPCWVMGLGQMPKSQAVVVARGQSIPAWARKALPSLSASAREMRGPWLWETTCWCGPSKAFHFIHPRPLYRPTLAQELLDENQKEVQGTK